MFGRTRQTLGGPPKLIRFIQGRGPVQLLTSRLNLRPLTSADASSYFELSQNDGFRQFQISDYRRSSVADAKRWIDEVHRYHLRHGIGVLGVFEKTEERLIGLCALKYLGAEGDSPVELMYRFSDQFWGRGYGREIAEALISYGFSSLNLDRIVATVDPQNRPSKKILESLGFQFREVVQIESLAEELHELQREIAKRQTQDTRS